MYKDCFKLMDINKDGQLDKNDLRGAFDNVGVLMTEGELDGLLGEVTLGVSISIRIRISINISISTSISISIITSISISISIRLTFLVLRSPAPAPATT